jgi:hypothetical protein
VIYVFGKRNIDHRRVVESFYDTGASDPVVIFQEGCYNHCIRESPVSEFQRPLIAPNTAKIKEAFEGRGPSSRFYTQIPPSYQEPGRPQHSDTAGTAEGPIPRTNVPDHATVLYIGGETLALTTLLMTHGGKNVRI